MGILGRRLLFVSNESRVRHCPALSSPGFVSALDRWMMQRLIKCSSASISSLLDRSVMCRDMSRWSPSHPAIGSIGVKCPLYRESKPPTADARTRMRAVGGSLEMANPRRRPLWRSLGSLSGPKHAPALRRAFYYPHVASHARRGPRTPTLLSQGHLHPTRVTCVPDQIQP